MSRFGFIGLAGLFALNLGAENQAALRKDDRLYDLEAQVSTLKADLESTKALATQERANAFNPSISVVGDMLGQYGFNLKEHAHEEQKDGHIHNHEFKNGFMVREVEFEFRGAVDPFADALVVLALEPHGMADVSVHLEEAYARLKKWPGLGFAPLGMSIKAGKFRTALGRMNRIHLHNIPQINYPMALGAFLGQEGYAAPGVSLNVAFNPTTTSALNLFAESVFLSKLPIQDKGADKMASGIMHAWWHQELGSAHALDVGISSLLGRKGKKGSGALWLFGSDVHYSYMPAGYGQNPLFLFGNEFFTANKREEAGRWPMGNFTWAQVRLFDATFAGIRYDLAPQEEDLIQFQHALGGYLTHYTTEFLRFRLGYEHVMPEISSLAGDHRVMLSMIFILGSHPQEPYFINR
jgi:hypothetical protein